jgi:restriction endonuclease S subunit
MYMKLKEIAAVYSGYTFRGAIKPEPYGQTAIIQARDVGSDTAPILREELVKTSFEPARADASVKENDVIIVARGAGSGSFRAAVFKGNDSNVIASVSVYIVRITSDQILPEFLALYLNSSNAQQDILDRVSGSYIKTIPRLKLEEVSIPMPSIAKQKSLIALHDNIRRQEEILERKSRLKEDIIKATLTNLSK